VPSDVPPSASAPGKRLSVPPHAGRVLQIVIGSLVLVVLIIIALGAILPGTWNVQRSILINAPPSLVHAVASDLEYWDDWAQWDHHDQPAIELGPIRSGVGASLRFSTPGAAEGGQVRILESDAQRGVTFEITIASGRPSRASLEYSVRLAATEVTWRDQGELPPIVGPLMRDLVETRLAGHMEVGLKRLKDQVERPAAP
jgi:polyketide cyclase/dehydrase/lipid transport protein